MEGLLEGYRHSMSGPVCTIRFSEARPVQLVYNNFALYLSIRFMQVIRRLLSVFTERVKGFEPSTSCLGSKHSTAELHPPEL